MKKIRCSLSYHATKLDEVPVFATGVRDGVYGNPANFNTPPLMQTEFQALIDAYNNTRAAYKQGGLAQKGPFLNAKSALMGGLDDTSTYVDTVANGDANLITLAGYVPTKGSASEVPAPVQVTGLKAWRGSSGQLYVECDKQQVAVSYGCIMSVGGQLPPDVIMNASGQLNFPSNTPPTPPPPINPMVTDGPTGGSIDFNTSRRKLFINLTPGVTYYFVMFAINAAGVGPISEPESIMCA
jgi:hypothetical protein